MLVHARPFPATPDHGGIAVPVAAYSTEIANGAHATDQETLPPRSKASGESRTSEADTAALRQGPSHTGGDAQRYGITTSYVSLIVRGKRAVNNECRRASSAQVSAACAEQAAYEEV
jgi:hypothetical protein